MTTSGTITYSLTARQIMTYALKKLRVLAGGSGETMSADQAADALVELNVLFKDWMKYPSLWRLTEGSAALVASTTSYALSPVPYRVVSARYRNTSSIDLPLRLMTREEYFNFPLKSGTGYPSQYYVDYQRATVTLYVFQCIASPTTETIQYTYQRKFEDIVSLDNELDIRQEHLKLAGVYLAKCLGPDYGRVSTASFAAISQEADMLLEQALDADREDEVRFVAGGAWG